VFRKTNSDALAYRYIFLINNWLWNGPIWAWLLQTIH